MQRRQVLCRIAGAAFVLGEEHFVTSMIKAEGNLGAFFERPIAGTLGAMMIALIVVPTLLRLFRRRSTLHRA